MDWQQFATNFGLPGLLIGVWYLLQSKRDAGSLGLEEKKLAIEERKLAIEDKKADAIVTAVTGLSTKIDTHHTLDLESHRELGEGIAEIKGQLEGARWTREELTNPGASAPTRRNPNVGLRAPSRGGHHDGDDT